MSTLVRDVFTVAVGVASCLGCPLYCVDDLYPVVVVLFLLSFEYYSDFQTNWDLGFRHGVLQVR